MANESDIEQALIEKLSSLKYSYRQDIRDREALERNFREKFEELNKVHLSDSEFERLLARIIDPDVFVSAKRLREIDNFEREDGTPLKFSLVNLKALRIEPRVAMQQIVDYKKEAGNGYTSTLGERA